MLSPYRVLDLTDDRGRFAGFVLAMLGADVVMVEPPGGSPSRGLAPLSPDGRSLAHLAHDRGKRSIELDLATPAGRTTFSALAGAADVVLQSATPGEDGGLSAAGLDAEQLLAAHPSLVVVSITPFGQDGPRAQWHATDLTVWASSGAMALCGDADRAPLGLTVPQAFLHGSSLGAAAAVLALIERGRSGRGQHVDVAAPDRGDAGHPVGRAELLHAGVTGPPNGWGHAGWRDLPPFRLPALDGHVSITHVFGAAVGPVPRRLIEYVHEEGFCDEATRDKDWVAYGMQLSDGTEPLSELARVQSCIRGARRHPHQGRAVRRGAAAAAVAGPHRHAHARSSTPTSSPVAGTGTRSRVCACPVPGPAPR